MSDVYTTGARNPEFLLTCRPRGRGTSALVLHVYRDRKLACAGTVGVVEDRVARMVLLGLRLHLFRLGLGEYVPLRLRAAVPATSREAA